MFRLFPKSYHELNLLMLWFFKCILTGLSTETSLLNSRLFRLSVCSATFASIQRIRRRLQKTIKHWERILNDLSFEEDLASNKNKKVEKISTFLPQILP